MKLGTPFTISIPPINTNGQAVITMPEGSTGDPFLTMTPSGILINDLSGSLTITPPQYANIVIRKPSCNDKN